MPKTVLKVISMISQSVGMLLLFLFASPAVLINSIGNVPRRPFGEWRIGLGSSMLALVAGGFETISRT